MFNKEIAKVFQFLGKIMELHGENAFKTRSYSNAYLTIRKLPNELSAMSPEDISEIPGIGKAISEKIQELLGTGELQTLNKYTEKTPEGVQNLLRIKGMGPKKVKQIWDELAIESPGELLYACRENRLVELKGFGQKTQDQLIIQLEYYFASKGKFLWATAEQIAKELIKRLEESISERFEITGELKRLLPTVDQIEILTTSDLSDQDIANEVEDLLFDEEKEMLSFMDASVILMASSEENFAIDLLESSSSEEFLDALGNYGIADSEAEIFENMDLPFIASEFREDDYALTDSVMDSLDSIIEMEDVKGVVHNHSTYSDGINSIAQMAHACQERQYDYLVMSDHSKSAFYANGLNEDRLEMQWREIDELNAQFEDFKIYKGIESDILSSGALDYDEDYLKQFDLIIASVHSNLKMDIGKATTRLIKAIENPYTRILGHPTGRLLLSRKGYPIDHELIIDACSANNVVIELNANPNRLDMDYTWIPAALNKGVMIAINPDAHSIKGIDDIRYGVNVARKGFLSKGMCLNTLNIQEFDAWIASK